MPGRAFVSMLAAFSLLLQGLTLVEARVGEWAKRIEGGQQVVERTRSRNSAVLPSGKRKLQKPIDPEAVGLLIHLLDRYSRDMPDKGELDRRIEQRLSRDPGSRESARRMVANFRSIPLSERRALMGRWAEIPAEERMPESRYRAAFERLARSVDRPRPATDADDHAGKGTNQQTPKHGRTEKTRLPMRGLLNPMGIPHGIHATPWETPTIWNPMASFLWYVSYSPIPTPQLQLPRYILWYEGLWCHRETDADHGTDSDEIYVITTVADAEGNLTTKLHPRPYDKQTYEDLDDGDHRVGPRSQVSGNGTGQGGRRISGLPAEDLVLNVTVFESDMGNPDVMKSILEVLIGVCFAVALVVLINPQLWPVTAAAGIAALAFGFAEILYSNISGSEDDLVASQTVTIIASQMQVYADEEPRFKKGEIPYHFSTIHKNQGNPWIDGPEGADYHVYFTVRRVPPPPTAR